MTLIAFVVVVFFMMIMPGCSSDGRPATTPDHQVQGLPSTIPPTPDAAEEGVPGFLEVEQFSLTKENLRVAYRVTNVFPHDIWVCANVNSLENQDSRFSVETEICDGTLHIRRRANLEQKAPVNFRMYAVYDRLQPSPERRVLTQFSCHFRFGVFLLLVLFLLRATRDFCLTLLF